MSAERVLLVGIKGSGKKTIRKALHKFFPQYFTPNENNILCLDLSKNRVKKILSADTLKETTIPVFVISCEREPTKLRFQEDFFTKFDKAIEKHTPETIILILVHKKDQFVDPIHKRDFLATCAKKFRRKRGKALIVSTSAQDYSIKRAFSKILKIRGALSLVAKRKIAKPVVKPPIPATSSPATSQVPPVGSPVKPEPELQIVPSIPTEKAEVPLVQPRLATEADDGQIHLKRKKEPVALTIQEQPEQIEGYESLTPSPPPSPQESTIVSAETFSREDFLKAARAEMEKIIEIPEPESHPSPIEAKPPTARWGRLGDIEFIKDFSKVVGEVKEHIDEDSLAQLHPTKELDVQSEALGSLEKEDEIITEQTEEAIPVPSETILPNELTETEVSAAYQLLDEEAATVMEESESLEEAPPSRVSILEDMTDLFEWSEQLEKEVSVEDAEELSRAIKLIEYLEDIKTNFNLNSVGLIDLESNEELVMIGGAPEQHQNIQQAVIEAMKHAEILNPIQIWEREQTNKNLGVIRKLTQTVAVIYIGTEQACETLHRKIEGISDQIKAFLHL
ncbi:MAG: hypothetical protein ACE5R6_01870 [Candidatus Heimdallarchaeota archaeon]